MAKYLICLFTKFFITGFFSVLLLFILDLDSGSKSFCLIASILSLIEISHWKPNKKVSVMVLPGDMVKKRCSKHIWVKETVKVIPSIKLEPGGLNPVYPDSFEVEICFSCNKIRNCEDQ